MFPQDLESSFENSEFDENYILNAEAFNGLTCLTHLTISGHGQFTHVGHDLFKNTPNLSQIHLFDNNIESFSTTALGQLESLRELNLDDNQLTECSFLISCPSLQLVSLYNNRNESLEWLKELSSFSSSKNSESYQLRELNLEYNVLTVLPEQVFSGLPGLVNLDLRGNEIDKIEPGAFDGLVNLRCLDLSYNPFEKLDLSVFDSADLVNLRLLNMLYEYFKPAVVYGKNGTEGELSSEEDREDECEFSPPLDVNEMFFSKCRYQIVLMMTYDEDEAEISPLLNELVSKGVVRLQLVKMSSKFG
jgi:Leucine-rich repeat (LRR) protein